MVVVVVVVGAVVVDGVDFASACAAWSTSAWACFTAVW